MLVDQGVFGSESFDALFSTGLSSGDYLDLVTEKTVQGGVQLTFDGGAKILLLGVNANDINHEDFLFAGIPV
jgi:hypothetical protein